MTIRIDDSDVQRGFRDLVDRQMPFVIAETINGVMIDAQKDALRTIHAAFLVRRPDFLRRTVKMVRFAKKRSQIAELAITGPGADIYAKFEEGGLKQPIRGKSLAIPRDVRRTKRDLITAKNKPRALINARKAFVIRTQAGVGLILERYGRKTAKKRRRVPGGSGRNTRVLYALSPKARIDDRLEFFDTVTRTFELRLDRQFEVAFTQALRTARR